MACHPIPCATEADWGGGGFQRGVPRIAPHFATNPATVRHGARHGAPRHGMGGGGGGSKTPCRGAPRITQYTPSPKHSSFSLRGITISRPTIRIPASGNIAHCAHCALRKLRTWRSAQSKTFRWWHARITKKRTAWIALQQHTSPVNPPAKATPGVRRVNRTPPWAQTHAKGALGGPGPSAFAISVHGVVEWPVHGGCVHQEK